MNISSFPINQVVSFSRTTAILAVMKSTRATLAETFLHLSPALIEFAKAVDMAAAEPDQIDACTVHECHTFMSEIRSEIEALAAKIAILQSELK